MDNVLEDRFGCTISDFIEDYGMESFRTEESDLLREIMSGPSSVIATGGGTPCSKGAMEWMRRHGVVVHLSVTPKVLAQRLKGNCGNRTKFEEEPIVLTPTLNFGLGFVF